MKPYEKTKIIATGLLYDKNGKVLTLKLKDSTGKLIQIPPGSRVEEGETLRSCIVREFKEEVNLSVKVIDLAGILEKEYEDGIWTIIY